MQIFELSKSRRNLAFVDRVRHGTLGVVRDESVRQAWTFYYLSLDESITSRHRA